MEEIEIKEYFYIIWRKKWLIVLIIVFSIAISGVFSFFVLESEYETFTTLMLRKPNSGMRYGEAIGYDDVLLNQRLVFTYGEIAKSRAVSNEVINNLGLNLTADQLKKKVKVSLVEDTEIIKIVVNYSDPEFATRIANETAEVFIKNVVSMLMIENVQVIDKAELPTNPIKPRPILNMAIAGVLGVMISVFLVLLLEYIDNTIKTPSDVEKYLDLPVIGMIPKILEQ